MVSLILASRLHGTTSKPPLWDEGRRILGDMGRRGNVLAVSVETKLTTMMQSAAESSLSTTLSTTLGASFDMYKHLSELASFDGSLLNGDMLKFLDPSPGQIPMPAATASGPAMAPQALTVDSQVEAATIAGPCLDGLFTNEDDFTFDVEDLQWLDGV